MSNKLPQRSSVYLRNFVFGVEDSLVSTVGLISGVAAAGFAPSSIIISGVVLIFVEAFSMGVGSLLSDNSAWEYERQQSVPLRASLGGGIIMLGSYFVAGLVPLTPYFLYPTHEAFIFSIVFSLLALFGLGLLSAHWSKTSYWRQGFEMLFIGGAAIVLGVAVGRWLA